MRRMLVVVACLLLAACSGDDEGSEPAPTTVKQGTELRVGDLPAAVGAVEAELGGPQRYAEINATPEGVNLFVATTDTEEQAWFYRSDGGTLEPPESLTPLSSEPFAVDGVDLSIAPSLVQQLQDRFPGSEVVQLALVHLDDQGLVWGLRSRSALGGLLNVFFSPTGALLAVDPVS